MRPTRLRHFAPPLPLSSSATTNPSLNTQSCLCPVPPSPSSRLPSPPPFADLLRSPLLRSAAHGPPPLPRRTPAAARQPPPPLIATFRAYPAPPHHPAFLFRHPSALPLHLRNCESVKSVDMIGFARSALSVLNDAELSIDGVENGSLIHMDVDQIFLPVPSPVKAAIFESFARQNMSESETDVTTSIKEFVKSNYGFPTHSSTEFIYADNSKALFNKLVLCCNKEGGTFCFPAGSNGNYVSSARFLKADTVTVPTDVNVGFKFTEKTLTGVLGTVKNPWVYISGPTVNPTGLVYSNNEIEDILSTCARFGARVIIDTSSSGLEFDCDDWAGWDLEGCLSKLNSFCKPSFCVSLLGGLSLKMLNGVLKFGFLILNQQNLVDTFCSYPGLSYAIKKLLELREQKPSKLSDAIAEHTRILRSRSKCLKEALEKSGWDVLESCAGVSVVAKPSAYLKKTVTLNILPNGEGSQGNATTEITLDDSNIRNAILKATGLCINSGTWTGIPGYCRFNIALEENDFKKALDCIRKFKEVALH